ncbi:MAG: hypothetical protein R6V44_14295 [Paracoccaceae bacterium]
MIASLRNACLVLALFGAPAAAEPEAPVPPDLAEAGEDLSPAEWRRLVAGRTVWYRIGEAVWGRERYASGADRVVFQFPDGECVEGGWVYLDPWYCFEFEAGEGLGGPHCFRHLRHEGELWALGMAGEPQRVERIDDTPLTCGPDVVS